MAKPESGLRDRSCFLRASSKSRLLCSWRIAQPYYDFGETEIGLDSAASHRPYPMARSFLMTSRK